MCRGVKVTPKQKTLIVELIDLLPESEKEIYQEITNYLIELGYIPQKQNVKNFILAFKHKENGKVIAKVGARKREGFVSIKFFACKNVPDKYVSALRSEIESHNGQYCGPVRSDIVKNACGQCNSCTGGGIGYYYVYPDGKEVLRCGAYPILIPGISLDDMVEMKRLILEQHYYFLSIA